MNTVPHTLQGEAAAERDAPAPEPDWTEVPERSNAFALRLMCWIALACGRTIARLVLWPVTLYFLLVAAGPRRHARRYLDRALARPAGFADVFRLYFTFASTVLDRIYLLRGRLDLFELGISGDELFAAERSDGRGAFLVGAHVGSFEALSAIGRHFGHARIAMVMYPDNARMINAALTAIAPEAAVPHIIPLGRPDSMLAIRDWLDEGGLAGMLGDRVVPSGTHRGSNVSVPFLGQDTVFNDGPFRLAAVLRRRVIFMSALYEGGGRYKARFELLADFSARCDAAERERRISAAVQNYASRLEALCRSHPYNWFNFHDFWREDRH